MIVAKMVMDGCIGIQKWSYKGDVTLWALGPPVHTSQGTPLGERFSHGSDKKTFCKNKLLSLCFGNSWCW